MQFMEFLLKSCENKKNKKINNFDDHIKIIFFGRTRKLLFSLECSNCFHCQISASLTVVLVLVLYKLRV